MLMKKLKSLAKYIPWEIFISPVSVAIPFAICALIGWLLEFKSIHILAVIGIIALLVGIPVIYIFLWSKLIKYSCNNPKALWRFIFEWGFGVMYILILLTKHFVKHTQFIARIEIPENLIGKIWYYFYLPFTPTFPNFAMGLYNPWFYIITGGVFIRICVSRIKAYHKETGKLW